MKTIIIYDGNEEIGRINDFHGDAEEVARLTDSILGFQCEVIEY